MDNEKKCELSLSFPNQSILDAHQVASQTTGMTVSLGQRWCRVPAMGFGSLACCLLHRWPLPEGTYLEGCDIVAPALLISWLEGKGGGKCALGKHR